MTFVFLLVEFEFLVQVDHHRVFPNTSLWSDCGEEVNFLTKTGWVFQIKPDKFWAQQGRAVNVFYFIKADFMGGKVIGNHEYLFLFIHNDCFD